MHPHRTIVRLVLFVALVISVTPIWAAAAQNAGTSNEVVNINTATSSDLTQLPRIGPALAARILEFRKENGGFKKAEDLMLVRGIGDRTFRLLEPFVSIDGKTTLKRKLNTADAEAAIAPEGKDGIPSAAASPGPSASTPASTPTSGSQG